VLCPALILGFRHSRAGVNDKQTLFLVLTEHQPFFPSQISLKEVTGGILCCAELSRSL
jgi:hypothetical protein